ncbi:olfactory receptor 10G6-like [Protobothrops mucrosquamatus]|uniref:olfactory receptor 10G6-like n=1 Tax=Protobothrops mucrosquamatus TaxID=103944 RepID=UPI0010FB6714|nr:olfactory receptor 10G6-like [Protobothrops mucrosquamatus]
MECSNLSAPNEFILSGFPYPQGFKLPLLLFFSIMFALTLSGNSLIILMVISDLQLHKPMYWFLCNLSILDMTISAVVVPKVIAGFNILGRVISFSGCVTQVFFLNIVGYAECFLFTVMSYDRFLAICKPLHYGNIMSWKLCLIFSLATIIGGCIHAAFQTSLTFHLSYGEDNYIDYVFCDVPPILKLACGDIHFKELIIIIDMGFVTMTCFLLILTSYVYIFTAILKISSREGWHKAFSTCSAHLTVVCLFFLPVFYHYLRPASQDSMDSVLSVFYTTITPLLNPLIYTLRNKEMKTALLKLWSGNPE